jgi:hypothetical protein
MAYKEKDLNNRAEMEKLFFKATRPNASYGPVYLDKAQEKTIEMDNTNEYEFLGGSSTSNKK